MTSCQRRNRRISLFIDKQEILDRIGEYYYGSDDTLIEQAVIKKINEPFVIYDGITNILQYDQEFLA
jgi:hypothetical protein